jgi:hypothetical protein
MQENFIFPSSAELFLNVDGSEHLKELLARQIQIEEMAFESKFAFYVSMKNPRLIRAKCSQCSAYLSYRAIQMNDSTIFQLKSYRLLHQHRIVHK